MLSQNLLLVAVALVIAGALTYPPFIGCGAILAAIAWAHDAMRDNGPPK